MEALSVLSDESWDLVICDQEMKQINGWVFIKEFKLSDKVPNIPAVLLGRGDAPDSEDVLKQFGLVKYLKMPVKPSNLDFLIHSTLSLAKTSGTIENKFTKAKESLIRQENEEAVELYSELNTLTKDSLRSNVGLAQAYVQSNQEDLAAPILDRIAKSGENSPANILLMARVFFKRGLKDEARAALEGLLDSHANEFYYSRCVALMIQYNVPEKAHKMTEQGRSKGFDVPEFYVCMSRILMEEGAYPKALAELLQCQEKFGESADLFNLQGVCYRKSKQVDQAVSSYEQALRLNPENHKVYFNLAICFIELDQMNEAIQHLETCVKLKPDFDRARDKLKELRGRIAS